jgi:hypothetical protein
METIHVPRPPKKARDSNRPANALLMSQVSHLQQAELKLPVEYCTKIYVHAIKTEADAAEYIREVTEAIHAAHADAAKRRTRRGLTIAAAAEKPKRKRKPKKTKRNQRGKKK